jgi:hypothetical protein
MKILVIGLLPLSSKNHKSLILSVEINSTIEINGFEGLPF